MRNKNKRPKGRMNAFSLAEILIVLAIMGILIMLVVPNTSSVASRAKAIEAKQELMMIYNLESSYKLEYSKFSNDFEKLGYTPHKTTKMGGTANYELTINSASNDNFEAQATATEDFDGDGQINVWTISKDGVPTEKQPD